MQLFQLITTKAWTQNFATHGDIFALVRVRDSHCVGWHVAALIISTCITGCPEYDALRPYSYNLYLDIILQDMILSLTFLESTLENIWQSYDFYRFFCNNNINLSSVWFKISNCSQEIDPYMQTGVCSVFIPLGEFVTKSLSI